MLLTGGLYFVAVLVLYHHVFLCLNELGFLSGKTHPNAMTSDSNSKAETFFHLVSTNLLFFIIQLKKGVLVVIYGLIHGYSLLFLGCICLSARHRRMEVNLCLLV